VGRVIRVIRVIRTNRIFGLLTCLKPALYSPPILMRLYTGPNDYVNKIFQRQNKITTHDSSRDWEKNQRKIDCGKIRRKVRVGGKT
jgi:hypothetical protein